MNKSCVRNFKTRVDLANLKCHFWYSILASKKAIQVIKIAITSINKLNIAVHTVACLLTRSAFRFPTGSWHTVA